ncbi:MAG: hypothetical protein JNL58_32935, partial [Planctomyces sp.]|nr:hypothetical protein [Planctomyces sp.]
NLEFRGRTDGQVKVRGFRIELGEVEDAIRRLPTIRDACVRSVGDLPSTQRLEAVVILKGTADSSLVDSSSPESALSASRGLRLQLSKCLPEYMIPGQFHFVDAFPLTQSGKLDRRAIFAALPSATSDLSATSDFSGTRLHSLESGSRPDNPDYPITELQQLLANLWTSLLPGKQIGIRDHFFEIGGHSLLAVVLT